MWHDRSRLFDYGSPHFCHVKGWCYKMLVNIPEGGIKAVHKRCVGQRGRCGGLFWGNGDSVHGRWGDNDFGGIYKCRAGGGSGLDGGIGAIRQSLRVLLGLCLFLSQRFLVQK